MNKHLYLLLFTFGLAILSLNCYSQSAYPIHVQPMLTPPYSLTLSDYAKPASQQLVVTIQVRDVTVTNLPVRLHLKIETTAGASFETLPNIITTPLYLTGGEMSILFGDDLKDYFNIDNLHFQGYGKEQYRRTGQLPEGFYRFTVEVRHFATGRLISNRGTATAWIALGKPPTLKIPEDKAELGQIAGMPLTFSWLPSPLGVPSAGLQYTFEVWEMRVPGIDPNVVSASMPVFHSATQFAASLIVHPAELMLEPGMTYAWRVTASDVAGQVPFFNDGHSEVRTFTYLCKCDSVTGFTVERRGNNGTFRWTPAANHTSFNVEIENPVSGWKRNDRTYDNRYALNSIDPGKTYRMRVQGVCNSNEESVSDFSGWQTLSVPEPQKVEDYCPDCECGGEYTPKTLTNFNLRHDLQPGDTIVNLRDGTRFILESVIPLSNGIYKGQFWFWAEIWNLKFLCDYWDLSVNTDNEIVDMDFESVYDPQFLLDAGATQDYVDEVTNAMDNLISTGNTPDTLSVDFTIPDNPEYYYDSEENTLIVMDDEGNSYTIDLPEKEDGTADLPATITDENGNVYDMDKNGALTEAKNKENISVEDKSIPEIDRNKLLWLQLQTNNDSLFNNHTLHLVQQTSSFVPVLIWVYSNKIINWMAKDLIEKHKIIGYRNLTQSDSIMWKQYNVRNTVVESETGAFFVPNIDNAGKYTLTADAQKAFNFMITYETDSIARIQRDTLLKGIDFAGDLKLKINLSVSKTGQILFKPINDNYHEHYGFDDAMKEECRQSKDFMGNSDYELLSINGIDYYAPWLGVLPNEEAEIKLEYTMPQADIDMLENDFKIVLKSSNTVQLLIDGKDKQEYDLFKTKNIKLKTESANEYEITAWLKDAAGRETMTGKLKIDCRDFKPAKKLRIIRVKRQDESSYPPPVNKTQLVNDVNKLYRQSFTQFELDNEAAYNDTLTIQKTSLDALNIEYFNTIGLKYESEIYYLYVVSSGVNVDQGEANMPHIAFSGYPENLTKTLVLFGNTDYDNAAHELGHVLGFKHTFEPYKTNEEVNYINVLTHKNRKVIDLYSTRNIMDYIYQGEPVTQRRYFFKYQIDHLK